MTCPAPLLPAIAHGIAACGIVALVAVLWTLLPGERDPALALTTVGTIGGIAWLGAAHVARHAGFADVAVNDNHPFDPLYLDWTPVTDEIAAR